MDKNVWLAIDTSSVSGSFALQKNDEILYQSFFNIRITHSETLMPQIDAGLKLCGITPKEIGGLIVTIGPGSFTGLRIGLATAKGIALANEIPLLSYTTLELIASNCYGSKLPILVCVDAKMQELYAAVYNSDLCEIISPKVIKAEYLSSILDYSIMLCGNGAYLLKPFLNKQSIYYEDALPHQNLPNAAGLFSLRKLKPQNEVFDLVSLAKLDPYYLREATTQVKGKTAQK